MQQISALRVNDLKKLLGERDLPTQGTKAELIKRLTDFEGSDVIDMEESQEDQSVRSQIEDLRSMIESVMTVVQQ